MTPKTHGSPFIALRWLAGSLVWAAQFLVVYAFESLICRNGNAQMHESLVLAVTATTITALIILIALGFRGPRAAALPGRTFMATVGVGLAMLGLLGVGWTAVVGIMLPSCSTEPIGAAKARDSTLATTESRTAGTLTFLLSQAPGAGEALHGGFVVTPWRTPDDGRSQAGCTH